MLVPICADTLHAQLKISQIYGAGSNVGSVVANDYVELHNPTAAPVSLTNWSLQYASDTGSSWSRTLLAGTVAPGGYFLVQQAAGSVLAPDQVPALPVPDAIGVLVLHPNAGKLALCSNTTLLTGIAPTAPGIVDFVGYGTSAGWREPFVGGNVFDNAPAPTASRAIFRNGCGASDTNNNAVDFSVGLPAPRSSQSQPSLGLSGMGAAFPVIVEAGFKTKLCLAPFLCSDGAPLAGASVVANLSAIGGSPTQTLFDDGSNGDEIAADGLYTFVATVDLATLAGSVQLPVVFSAAGQSGSSHIGLVVAPIATPDNDNCVRAQPIAGPYIPPVDTLFDLAGANVESNPIASLSTAPLSGMSARRGLWYSVVGTGHRMHASLCASNEDTVLIVFGGSCDGLTVVANGDDNGPDCTGGAASAAWCSLLGETYWVWIAEFHGAASTLSASLRISDEGLPCSSAVAVAVCAPSVPPGSIPEAEAAWGIGTNDGCDNNGARFSDVSVGYPATRVRGHARGFGDSRDGDWYRFQAAGTDTLTLSVAAQFSAGLSVQLLSAGGGCPSTTVANSTPSPRCGSAQLSVGVVAGNWYAVRVLQAPSPIAFGGVMPGGSSSAYSLALQLGGPPANDDCANASPLTLGAAAVIGNLSVATPDGSSACDATGRDLWYRVSLPIAGTLLANTCGSATDTVLSVFGACGGIALACNDDATGSPCAGPASAIVLPGLSAGTYWLRVSDKNLGGSFRIQASFSLDNDDCATAIPLGLPSLTNAHFAFAQSEPLSLSACSGPFPGQSQNYNYTAGVWYSLVSPLDQTITIDTLLSATDTKLWVFDGSGGCGALTCVTANDDIQGAPFQSKLAFTASAGVSYYLLVGPFSNGQPESDFTLNLRGDPTPLNDRCVDAPVLAGASGSIAGTLIGATGENNTSSQSHPSCSPGTSVFDVWYRFSAPCNGDFEFSTCGATDTLLSLHTSCPSLSVSNQLLPLDTSCNDDGPAACLPGSRLSLALVLGGEYWIRVASARGALPEGPFVLTWTSPDADGDGTPDCLDGCPLDPLKIAAGTCGCGTPDTDSDGDGTPDCADGCPLDPQKRSPGACGCGTPDTDSDGDGTPNCLDGCPFDPLKISAGLCGCGTPETDSDGDGTPDCIDGCPLDPAKIAPGICGCGVPDVDSDGDGFADCIDNCPAISNPTQADGDGDGVGDGCDNCPQLANPGQQDCDSNGIGDACEIAGGTWPDCDLNGIPDNCDPDCNFNGVADACDIASGSSWDLNSNGIPDECEPSPGTLFCFGDGSGTACPCGNASVHLEGCVNSTGRGALLYNAGSSSVSFDDALPLAIQLPPNKVMIFFTGTTPLAGGNGVAFYDGLLCLAPMKRYAAQVSNASGVAGLTQPVQQSGGLMTAGSTWNFQAWFRDGASGPCGTKVNLSNGLAITFTP